MIMFRAIDSIEDVLEHITSDLWQKKHELRRITDGDFDPVLVFEVERVIALLGIAADPAHDAVHNRRRRLGWERPPAQARGQVHPSQSSRR
jgi:hypothetical protein